MTDGEEQITESICQVGSCELMANDEIVFLVDRSANGGAVSMTVEDFDEIVSAFLVWSGGA